MDNADAVRLELIERMYDLLQMELQRTFALAPVHKIDAIIRIADRIVENIDRIEMWKSEHPHQ